MSKKVTYARFHTTLHIPNFGNLENVMPPSGKTLKSFSMVTSDGGIEVTACTMVSKTSVTFLVPWANVQLAVIQEEEAAKPAA